MSIKEELLTISPLRKKTRVEDVYCAFKKYIEEKNIPIYKVVSMTTDRAPSMTGTVNGFLAMCMRDDDFPHFLSYHCIIHIKIPNHLQNSEYASCYGNLHENRELNSRKKS
ncbi:uncharacterized protein TNCV_1502471 [Trichonephila clavipes]|uniref:DUF4371 domain-containing protein n=1 Tax=Trichonephila clavipes TaxID=2585209 RepID=A0A8X6VA69_TRICX|nr:uncharacterized protein TNCV_1502471 [Trichonephila clavipes]